MKKKILVIAAHPDDETLGCGGTIAKLVKNNHIADVVFLSSGVGARKKKINSKNHEVKLRKSQAKSACSLLGFNKIKFYDLPDNSFETIPRLRINKIIEKEINESNPEIIFTHFNNDLNLDHRIVAESAVIATRFYKKKHSIFSFEVLSSTDLNLSAKNNKFQPNYYVDIGTTINLKIEALKKYKHEIRKYPHPRSVDGIKILSNYRGMFSNCKNAEAFILLKQII